MYKGSGESSSVLWLPSWKAGQLSPSIMSTLRQLDKVFWKHMGTTYVLFQVSWKLTLWNAFQFLHVDLCPGDESVVVFPLGN